MNGDTQMIQIVVIKTSTQGLAAGGCCSTEAGLEAEPEAEGGSYEE